ncbi:MAG: ChaN family lipoprotein [Bacteroidota bacterium]|nr:ChaN family lipoprotein [Bacteroidota bacterium]
MKNYVIVAFSLLLLFGFKPDLSAYKLFDSAGKETNYAQLLKEAKSADVILFGELHDNPISHWLQLQLTRDLADLNKGSLIFGAEMFEADDQIAINEYLAGKITEKTFLAEVKLWPNYKTDYKPLMELAKTENIPFIATNVPRRYANLVYSKGINQLDSLDPESKKWMVPLPMKYDADLKCYKDIILSAGGHGGENLPKSQALKDATMAYFIMKNLESKKKFIHYNGAYHSNFHEGIEWYLKQSMPQLKVLTINTSQQNGIDTLSKEAFKSADFIICTPENMTKTH